MDMNVFSCARKAELMEVDAGQTQTDRELTAH